MTSPTPLSAAQVRALAEQHGRQPPCPACQPFDRAGWDSFPSTVSDAALQCLGALWSPAHDTPEPTLEEQRPPGIDQWSPQAPIALGFFPYNRCEVWACKACQKPFLRYTEYGGYYHDARLRTLDAARLTAD